MNLILNIVSGLIFTWLLLCLAAMYIQEWIASKQKWRPRMLEATIRNMLSDPELADQLYNHPLIRNLYSGNEAKQKPSYIPSSQFSMALLDIVRISGLEASLIQQQIYKMRLEMNLRSRRQRKAVQRRLNPILALTRQALVSEVDETSVGAIIQEIKSELLKVAEEYPKIQPAIDNLLNKVKTQKEQIEVVLSRKRISRTGQTQPTPLDQIYDGISALGVTHPRLKQALLPLIIDADEFSAQGGSGLIHARQNIEQWFNNSMDRLSGWYKRRVQMIITLIGLTLVIAMNADSFLLAKQLWREPILHEAMTNQTESLVTQDEILPPISGQLLQLQQALEGINLPFGWIDFSTALTGNPTRLDNPAQQCTIFPQNAKDIYGLQIYGQCFPLINTPRPNDLTGWLMKLVGLLVTGMAISQGAPFWFDILKKIINIRISGTKPTEAQNAVG